MAKEFVPINDIMKDDITRAQLQLFIDEAVALKAKIAALQEQAKDVQAAAVEAVKIEPKIFKYYADMVFKGNIEERAANISELEQLVHRVMQLSYAA